ncbi:MAG: hypothetical protein WDN01_00315 [Rhizomicrobium sp.]
MHRPVLVAAVCLLLAGCESYGDLTSDAFEPGAASQSRFTFDSADCEARAGVARNYDIHGIAGTHAERHEMFNRVYTACMGAAGYARRDWSPDIAFPYKVDPTPG